jgi:hypothetical protein
MGRGKPSVDSADRPAFRKQTLSAARWQCESCGASDPRVRESRIGRAGELHPGGAGLPLVTVAEVLLGNAVLRLHRAPTLCDPNMRMPPEPRARPLPLWTMRRADCVASAAGRLGGSCRARQRPVNSCPPSARLGRAGSNLSALQRREPCLLISCWTPTAVPGPRRQCQGIMPAGSHRTRAAGTRPIRPRSTRSSRSYARPETLVTAGGCAVRSLCCGAQAFGSTRPSRSPRPTSTSAAAAC